MSVGRRTCRLQRFRTEQPPYSILNRGIEREVLPIAQQYGMGVMVWGPFGQGLLTGRVRKGGDNDLKRVRFSRHLTTNAASTSSNSSSRSRGRQACP